MGQPVQTRLNNFDFLRLFLAVVVIFSHSFPLGVGSDANEPFIRITHGQTTSGTIAVNFFFIMSGYLIAASFVHSAGVLDYLRRRVRRIYPGFIASMLFCALVIVPLAGGVLTGHNRLINLIVDSLLLHPFSQTGAFSTNPYPNKVNGSVWTISFEFGCYLGLLILGVTGALSRRRVVLGIFLGSVILNIWRLHVVAMTPSLGANWAKFIPMYLAGVMAYLYRDRIRYTRNGSIVCCFALLAASAVPFAWVALFPFAGAYLLFWIAFSPSIRLSDAAKYGDFSYGTYLYAFPLQQMIVRVWAGPMNPMLLFLLATPLALLFAIASWHFIERPFLRMGKTPYPKQKAIILVPLSVPLRS
jgi:peptidoglycan/LPS O-acetylase OafA/YrhL